MEFYFQSNSVMNNLKCPRSKWLSHRLTELFPIYQSKHWTIRQQDDHSVDPSCHWILSLIVQPTIECSLFWLKKVHFRAKCYTFLNFMLIDFLVWTLQYTGTVILYLFCSWKLEKNNPSKQGTFAKLQKFKVLLVGPKPAQISNFFFNYWSHDLYTLWLWEQH